MTVRLPDFLARLHSLHPVLPWQDLEASAGSRLEAFALACPLYTRLLEQRPEWVWWLESPRNLREEFRYQALVEEWRETARSGDAPSPGSPAWAGLLRRFRRKMSLRIAYREVTGMSRDGDTVAELTRLAEFCLGECVRAARDLWSRRLGEPWDEARQQPSRFCVLGLGKLGGRELNFSSDIDLIYVWDGNGHPRHGRAPTGMENAEWFHRVGETVTQLLHARDAEGFLFRADLRLRPGGASAPLVPAVEAVEHYYAAAGQAWERMALLKARPVAGDLALGAELLENLQSFRYPRHPPVSLLAEVAAMKTRTEREVVGASALERDLKSGVGGIREIEFFAQAMQLLHAGSFPFLQTHSTVEAIRQLVRYDLLAGPEAVFLESAYWFLRRVEHRLQMAEEQQTHELPVQGAERERLARGLGFTDRASFEQRLDAVRRGVRRIYGSLFSGDGVVSSAGVAEEWWRFFADGREDVDVARRISGWMGPAPETRRELRLLVCGSAAQPFLRDQVQRFMALLPTLDRILPTLARPAETLRRISSFAERHGSRNQFLATCAMNAQLFEVLALLFDRSGFIHELLLRHPEIVDEVLRPEILRKRLDLAARRHEFRAQAPSAAGGGFARWLWLYVRAEQVRAAIGQLLGFFDDADAEAGLNDLAEAVVLEVAARVPGCERLGFVALGKFGGRELTFGSDLDMVVLGEEGAGEREESALRGMLRLLGNRAGGEPLFAVDLRLRPHAEAGPLIATVASYRDYFSGPSARPWERQLLTRARFVAGPEHLRRQWAEFIDAFVYGSPPSPEELSSLWHMRLRVQSERDAVDPPERAFKTGAGGLIDVEFALQILQLVHGPVDKTVRSTNTGEGWRALKAAGRADPALVEPLLANHQDLKRIEWCLRRDTNRSVSVLPAEEAEQEVVARWLGAAGRGAFLTAHRGRMQETRRLVSGLLAGVLPAPALESGR